MPQVGFGTWGVKPRDVDTSLRAAVAAGYRLFDLAPVYNNQKAVGETLRALQAEGAVTRDQLFLTSKVPPLDACAPGGVEASARQTLRDVQTSYLDLLLVHWPFCVRNGSPTWPPPLSYQLGYSREQLRETWRALEGLHASGAVRAIGLSNIGPHRLKALRGEAKHAGVDAVLVVPAQPEKGAPLAAAEREELEGHGFTVVEAPWEVPPGATSVFKKHCDVNSHGIGSTGTLLALHAFDLAQYAAVAVGGPRVYLRGRNGAARERREGGGAWW